MKPQTKASKSIPLHVQWQHCLEDAALALNKIRLDNSGLTESQESAWESSVTTLYSLLEVSPFTRRKAESAADAIELFAEAGNLFAASSLPWQRRCADAAAWSAISRLSKLSGEGYGKAFEDS